MICLLNMLIFHSCVKLPDFQEVTFVCLRIAVISRGIMSCSCSFENGRCGATPRWQPWKTCQAGPWLYMLLDGKALEACEHLKLEDPHEGERWWRVVEAALLTISWGHLWIWCSPFLTGKSMNWMCHWKNSYVKLPEGISNDGIIKTNYD